MEAWLIPLSTIVMSLVTTAAAVSYWSGKAEQRMNDTTEAVNKRLDKHESIHSDLFGITRSHESNDQRHFADTDVHWGKFERDWQKTRFENLEKLISRQDARFDKQDEVLAELLRLTNEKLAKQENLIMLLTKERNRE